VILRFTENLNQVTDDFVFKGGNLLWVYIDTPRTTTDLDLATLKSSSHGRVRAFLEKACKVDPEIQFKILGFKEIEQEGKIGAAVTFGYATEQGASNRFEADIVYALGTDMQEIESPLGTENTIQAATIENIIVDKVSACHRFGSGNTRMKDFDDLWRLSKSGHRVIPSRLRKLFQNRKCEPHVESDWIAPDMRRSWKLHSARYKDLPVDLNQLFADVNSWLDGIL